MALLSECREARHDEDVARLRRVLALRAMVATGMSQREIATALGISQPAVSQHGSVARREAGQGSGIDLLVEAPKGTSSFGFVRFKQLLERVLGRQIDLVDYGGRKPTLDDDIRREAVLL